MNAGEDAFDVVILGGGPAGCAAALTLARLGIERVLLVEAARTPGIRIGESIPPDTRVVLNDLGVFESFLKEEHEPCLGSCSCWGSDELGYNDFLFNPLGNGWHLDRGRFDAFLCARAGERGTVVRSGTRFAGCERAAGGGLRLRLNGDDGRRQNVDARFAVDATGMRSAFARAAGAERLFLDQLICVTAYLELAPSGSFSKLTLLEAVEYGWWYAAKLPNRRVAVAVASDVDTIKERALRTPEGWRRHLEGTRHVSTELAGCRLIENSHVTSAAASFVLDRVAGEGWVAAGDAASAYDPISSQGIYKALVDGVRAGTAVAGALRGSDAGLTEHQRAVGAAFADYLAGRNYFYGLERRWPTSSFWTRRQARTVALPGRVKARFA